MSQHELKINSNGKKCSVLYCFTVLCNFLECNHNVKPVCVEITIKFLGKPCMKWKSQLKYLSWYKVELCIVIRTRVIGILVNQNEGKFKGNLKFGNCYIPAVMGRKNFIIAVS